MIFRTVYVIFVVMLSAETLPVPNMNLRPVSVNRVEQNFGRPHSQVALYPPLPLGRYPQIFPGHRSSPIRGPAVQVSDILDQKKKKIDGFLPIRSMLSSSVFFDQYHNVHQQTAQKVKQLGQQVKDNVQLNKKLHVQRMQHMNKMMDNEFRFDSVKNRLRDSFVRKKALMDKLHSFGRREKFAGIPYHTMNDDHMIVKKPGVDFNPTYLSNVGTSIGVPVPAIQPNTTQHPVVPEVTTSVELHQEWEVPGAIDGYLFPITSVASHTPEVTETTEITTLIDQGKQTTPQSPQNTSTYTDTTVKTIISTHPESDSIILEASTTADMPFNETNDSVAEVETIFASVDEFSTTENEQFDSLTSPPGAIAEIDSSSFSSPSSTDTTSQMEITSLEPQTSQTAMLIDLLPEIQVKPVKSSVIDVESTTNNIRSTFPPSITTIDDEVDASSVIDTVTTVEAIISTVPSTFLAVTTLGTGDISPHTLALETSTIVGITAITETAFTSPTVDPESNGEAISTVSFSISTEGPAVENGISTTVDTVAYGSTIDRKMTTDIGSTMHGAIAAETTLRPTLFLDTVQISDVSSALEYNRFPSFLNTVDSTSEVDSILLSTITTEENTMATESFIEAIPTFFSSIPTATTTILDELSTTGDLAYNSSTNHRETTTEVTARPPSATTSDTTAWLSTALETTPPVDVSSRYESNYSPSFIDEKATTVSVESTLLSTVPTKVTEELTFVDAAVDNPTIKTEKNTDAIPTFTVSLATQPTTSPEKPSTTADSQSDYSSLANPGGTMAEIINLLPSVILSGTTAWTPAVTQPIPPIDTSSRFGYNDLPTSTDEVETTTEADNPTIKTKKSTDAISTFTVSFATQPTTSLEKLSTTADSQSDYNSLANSGGTMAEIITLLPSVILSETTAWTPAVTQPIPPIDTSSRFGYNDLPTSTDEVETTTEADNPTIKTKKSTDAISAFTVSFATQPTTSLEKLSTTADSQSDYNSLANSGGTMAEIITLLPSVILSETTAWTPAVTQPIPPIDTSSRFGYNDLPTSTDEVETTTGAGSTFPATIATEVMAETVTTVDSVVDESTRKMERKTEIASSLYTSLSTETTTGFGEKSTTVKSDLIDSASNGDTTMEIVSVMPTSISSETTTWPPPAVETTPLVNISTKFGYSHFPSLINYVETTTKVGSTFPSTIASEILVTEILETDDSAGDDAIIETKKTTKIIPEISFSLPTETTMAMEEIYAAADADYIISTSHGETTYTTTWPPPVSETTPLVNVLSRFGSNRVPSSTDEAETTTRGRSTLPFIISIGTTNVVTERSTTIDPAFGTSTIEKERTEGTFPNFPFTTSSKTNSVLEETSTATSSPIASSKNSEVIMTDEFPPTFPSTVPTEATITPVSEIATVLDTLPPFEYNHVTSSTIGLEPTASNHASLYFTTPTETTTMVIEETTVDSRSDYSTIGWKIITEENPEWLLATSTETPATSNEISTTTDLTSGIVSTLPNTIFSEAISWPVPDLEITPVVDALPKFGYNRFPGLTDEMEKTTGVYSTFLSTIPAVTTTTPTAERLTTVDLGLNILTIDAETTTKMISTIPSIITTETAAALEQKSTTALFDNSLIDEIITVEVIPTADSTFPTEITTAPVSGIRTTLEDLQTYGHDHDFTLSTTAPNTNDEVDPRVPSTIVPDTDDEVDSKVPSTIAPNTDDEVDSRVPSTIVPDTDDEVDSRVPLTIVPDTDDEVDSRVPSTIVPDTDDEVDSRVPATISTKTIAIEAERSGTSALKSQPFDLGITTDMIDSSIGSSIATEKTATSREISTIGSLPFDSSTIPKETTTQVIMTFPSTTLPTGNETVTTLEEISSATDSATTVSTDDSDTTTEIDSTSPTAISTETTVVPTRKYDPTTEPNSGYLSENQTNLNKRNGRFLNTNLDPAWPRFAHNSEEEPSEKTSLDLIPMIIEYYAKIT